jgi:uncharacterized protein (TIGR02246 family)
MNKQSLLALAVLAGVALSAAARADDQAEIKALEDRVAAAFRAKDTDRVMSGYVSDESLFVFDIIPPRQYVGAKAYRKDFEDLFAQYPGPLKFEISDLSITADGKLGFAHYIGHLTVTNKEGKQEEFIARTTDCLRKVKGKWLISHEHNSFPADLSTGKADMLSKP